MSGIMPMVPGRAGENSVSAFATTSKRSDSQAGAPMIWKPCI
jgi:hypothetical protein